jgi:hypothetical protein
MTQTTATAGNWLKLILNATAIANIADNAASGALTNLYVSLHTASPGLTGDQTTNEAAYTSYARVAVVRTSSGWTITGNQAVPAATITFPTATGGSETETFMGIGSLSSGAGVLYWYGSISPTIGVTTGVTPQLTTATVITAT